MATQPAAVDVVELVSRAQAGDREALGRLVEANLGLVKQVVYRHRLADKTLYADLAQEASMAFLHAVRCFNPAKGVKLSTYAAFWMRKKVAAAVAALAEDGARLGGAFRGEQAAPEPDEPPEAPDLAGLLCVLPAQEYTVLCHLYGLAGSPRLTCREVAARIGRTRQRVRQLELRALARLRAAHAQPRPGALAAA